MPLFERPPLETLAPARDRWTPLYLEHGRLEVDDSSVKWVSADGLLCRLPIATISALILGPGTTITHAAVKACAESNASLCWTGEESLRFYAFGLAPNHTNDMPRLHAAAWADRRQHTQIARKMFRLRYPDLEVEGKAVNELRGAEGLRVRALYAKLGLEHGVTWRGRNYDRQNWEMSDAINRALSTANACLYAICAAVVTSLGYLPSLGFVHDAGTLPFVYDVADLYKHQTSIPAAFLAVRQAPEDSGELVRRLFKQHVEQERVLQRLPRDLAALFGTTEVEPQPAQGRPSSAIG